MTVLIVTDASLDGHLRLPLKELMSRGLDVAVVDPARLARDGKVTVANPSGGQSTTVGWGGDRLNLSTITSVWYRRPGTPEPDDGLEPSVREWIDAEFTHLLSGIWENLDALWVSHPTAIRRAGRKLLQLSMAERLGLRVPDYLMTNEPDEARRFHAAHPQGVIVKALGRPTVMSGGWGGMLYTHLLTPGDLELMDHVAVCPTFFQEFIPKRHDVRVTVFGKQLFAVAIDSSTDESARTDFRRAEYFRLPHVEIELPADVHRACLALVAELGLNFGAIDLLQTPDDEWVFLEINPNGQWMWLEMLTGLPMTRSLCDMLEAAENGQRRSVPEPIDAAVGVGTEPAPTRIEFGSVTVATPQPLDPAMSPDMATRVWADEDRHGRLQLHVGDFDDSEPG